MNSGVTMSLSPHQGGIPSGSAGAPAAILPMPDSSRLSISGRMGDKGRAPGAFTLCKASHPRAPIAMLTPTVRDGGVSMLTRSGPGDDRPPKVALAVHGRQGAGARARRLTVFLLGLAAA